MSDCVPYAVHIVTGKAYEEVLAQAKNIRGWDEVNGIHPVGAWLLLKDFGCQITQMLSAGYRVTLARFKKQLDPQKTYIISTDAHWFVIRRGVTYDLAETHGRSYVRHYIEILHPGPAFAEGSELNATKPLDAIKESHEQHAMG
ncbi:TPA: hypothetical protein ACGW3N_000160 [Pseudomonas aeruginosa]|uniref:Uncharacterized protein n=1 Tax=Pseudomonas aeruginosa TaxID=287 RepID=A0A241XRB0_PSEAI|nr:MULTISPECIES: hypothetical protein [Pseudomonas]ELG7184013.1 hypothetical protein [Pseudomonas aeruginosa]MBI6602723.1 hypothetical protein [Pseudomonas sp. S4_EA_1b]MBI8852264.1 hypothetical protein [Pseudomonas aeruginosa]OBY57060.1 hypothetical protein A9513_016225 [Pseudomonas sp. AU12215]OTI63029.1 hypothetical protein CAZ10_09290 [Pseudomonas aeruginosa]